MEGALAVSIPIFICVVLPIAIVGIVFASKINKDNKRAKVLIKAIESNSNIDADKLAEAIGQSRKTAREILNLRLLRGCIYTLIGLGLTILGTVFYCMDAEAEFSDDSVSIPMICGGISLAIGVSYLIVYFITRRQVKD